MTVTGNTNLISHAIYSDRMINESEFTVRRGDWVCTIPACSTTDGASIPKMFQFIWKPFNPDYAWKALVHDLLCGQFSDRIYVYNATGAKRQLTWKEAAVWFRDLMKHEDSNNKLTRRLFYHAIMSKKRLGLRK